MSAPTLYSGPGKTSLGVGAVPTYNSFQAEGENGQVKIELLEERVQRSNAMVGYLKSTLQNQKARVTLTPFDSWSLLPVLYPAFLGVSVTGAAQTGALVIGTRPHDNVAGAANGLAPCKVWTPDGRLYTMVRSAIVKHPNLKLGTGMPMFGPMEIVALWDAAGTIGTSPSTAFMAVTESAASDPNVSGTGAVPDFVTGHWTGAWGSVTGFTTLDPEDGWDIAVDAKYSELKVQGRTYHYKLDSVQFVVKGRLTGPTHTQLLAKVTAHTLGAVLTEGSATDLVLSGPSSKTVTLKDCEVYVEGSGFEFGGTKLGTGEVAFVTQQDFTSGLPTPALIFS